MAQTLTAHPRVAFFLMVCGRSTRSKHLKQRLDMISAIITHPGMGQLESQDPVTLAHLTC